MEALENPWPFPHYFSTVTRLLFVGTLGTGGTRKPKSFPYRFNSHSEIRSLFGDSALEGSRFVKSG